MTKLNFTVGAQLYFDGSNRLSEVVTVTKVGRRWATLSNRYRADTATGQVESQGCGPVGVLYASKAEFVAHRDLCAAWNRLRSNMSDFLLRMPADMTIERINQARELLGIPVKV